MYLCGQNYKSTYMNSYKFLLKDYQAVHSAEIDLNGVTIIAGENGCGKSTTTRWIYYLMEVITNFEKYAFKDYKRSLFQLLSKLDSVRREVTMFYSVSESPNFSRLRNRLNVIQGDRPDDVAAFNLAFEEYVSKLSDILESYFDSPQTSARKQRLLSYIGNNESTPQFDKDAFVETYVSQLNNYYDRYIDNCARRNNVSMWRILQNYFDDKLTIPQKINFQEDGVDMVGTQQLGHLFGLSRCIYVDTPMALARMSDTDNVFWKQLRTMMFAKRETELSLPAKKMIMRIRKIINGSIIIDPDSIDDDELRFVREDGELNIPIEETATGLKSFAYVLKLLENGLLDSQTMLIIDEPEVHLHPQWVVEFARILLMLNKELGVHVVLASHNPDFVSAIRAISEAEGVLDKTNFYLAKESDSHKYMYDFKSLAQNIGPIFESFNIALSRIELYGTGSTGICE